MKCMSDGCAPLCKFFEITLLFSMYQEYGGLENCPEFISGNIVEMECYSQTEVSRQKFADYLTFCRQDFVCFLAISQSSLLKC